jgi:hypothetical protein
MKKSILLVFIIAAALPAHAMKMCFAGSDTYKNLNGVCWKVLVTLQSGNAQLWGCTGTDAAQYNSKCLCTITGGLMSNGDSISIKSPTVLSYETYDGLADGCLERCWNDFVYVPEFRMALLVNHLALF